MNDKKELARLKAKEYYHKKKHDKDWYQKELVRKRELDRRNSAKRKAKKYGITPDLVNELLSRGCEVCGSMERLHIDHDHVTGQVRGCLCNHCNIALGHLKDDPERILNLHRYITTAYQLGKVKR